MSFAFKIDKALKANLYKICRLCGIDRDEKFEILDAEDTDEQQPLDCDGELKLHQKIIQCIGITVCKDDKMPQSACGLCVDKINDFYEFREMCYATDVQTRKLLGLKGESQKKIVNPDVKPIIDIKEETIGKRGRKRKPEEPIVRLEATEVKRETNPVGNITKKQRLNEPPIETKKKGKLGKQVDKTLKPKEEIKEEPVEAEKPSTANSNITKFRQTCNICSERFGSKLKLDQHVAANHLPNIPRYYCTACNETIKKTNDIKSHQLWHKLSKTPYMCGHCGQLLTSSYMYSRHLRDHTVEIPPNLWILDRECPQCHQTFLTNYLYNTHPCAVRTKKCAGCNRQLRNELEYQRHAAHCAKVYLNYSKHIPAAAVAAESTIRIKNENDVEAAAAEALVRTVGITLDMAPIVSLTRISTPEILAASQGKDLVDYTSENAAGLAEEGKTPGKKSTKKGVSRKDLKRVDDLLKSTLDALVSIKHEPEVHVEVEGETPAPSATTANKEDETAVGDDDRFNQNDDFHHAVDDDDDDDEDDDDDDDGDENNVSAASSTIGIKQEQVEDGVSPNAIHVKQEVVDVDNDNPAPATKMPSDINEHPQEASTQPTEAEAPLDKESNSNILKPIKQERLDETDEDDDGNKQTIAKRYLPGVDFGDTAACEKESADVGVGEATAPVTLQTTAVEEEIEDVKPNKAELDRLFQITSVSCGVQMEHEQENETDNDTDCSTEDTISARESVSQEPTKTDTVSNVVKRKSVKTSSKVGKHKSNDQKSQSTRSAKAFKSTSGINKPNISGVAESNTSELSNIQIKPEPVDAGYEDQEKDVDVADVEITNTHIMANALPNGMRRSNGEESQYTDGDNTDTSDNEETDDDEDDEEEGDGNDDWVGIKQEMKNANISKAHNDDDDDRNDLSSCSIEGNKTPENHALCELDKPTTSTLTTEDRQNSPPPFIITGVYCQAEDGENGINNAKPTLPKEADVQYSLGVLEPPPAEVPTLKIANILSGCSVSFNDLSKNDDLLTVNVPATWTDEPMDVGEETEGGTIDTTVPTDSLHTTIAQQSAVEAMDIPPAVETMCLEINQGKEMLLNAQPFLDGSAETLTAIDTTQMLLSSNVPIGEDVPLQSSAATFNAANAGLVEEAQNMLNQEVVEAQANQRLTLESATTQSLTLTEPTQNIEETENLMNESVAETQRQERQATAEIGDNVLLRRNDVEYSSGSSSSNSRAGRTSQSIVFNNPFLLDDSNINEIAENHNNANIERELQDDIGGATTAANASESSENVIPRQGDAEAIRLNMNDVT
ncbi:unnamed protein product [Ceratitis capitata]|uniref:(Mediterranean fruit fly) hypothetical protein n=1 Tax=Ceratitis capitata TaxID=7213 RepID=A0A811U792_CERCA|nr:unnamed protein product [Ceratitis capitata]